MNSLFKAKCYESNLGYVRYQSRILKADTFPMGIDYERFSSAVQNPDTKKEIKKIREEIGEKKNILSIDRMDYTKGIIERLESYELFLQENPEYLEKVILIMVAVPSRTRVKQYQQLKQQVDKLVDIFNKNL